MGTPTRPGIVFMGGFMSDMTGIKATSLEDFAGREGLPYLRFDYSGHGASEGRFEDGTIGGPDFGVFLMGFLAGAPGPSGLLCAGVPGCTHTP